MLNINRSELLGVLGRLSTITKDKDAGIVRFAMSGATYSITADNKRQRLRETRRLTDVSRVEHWTCYPDAQRLTSIVRVLDSQVIRLHLDSKRGKLEIEGGTSRFSLNVHTDTYEDFPPDIERIEGKWSEVNACALRDALSRVLHAVSEDDNRYGINGVHIESLEHFGQPGSRLVATDGSRLFYVALDYEGERLALAPKTILPRSTAVVLVGIEADKSDSVRVFVSEDGRSVQFDWVKMDVRLVTSVIDGDFPAYRQVIDSAGKRIGEAYMQVGDLTSALSQVGVLQEDKNRTVRLNLFPDTARFTVTSSKSGDATASVGANYIGQDGLVVGLNAKFIAEAAKACKSDEVRISFGGLLDPVLITAVGIEGAMGVVMPVRLE